MFPIENTSSLPSTSSSPQEVPVVSSLVCDSVFTMEDNFLLPSTSSPQEVPESTKKPNGKRKSASSSKGKAKKKKEANLGEGENSSGEMQIVSPLVCSVFNMEDNFLLPSTFSSQQEVPENKTKQKAKLKSSKGKAKKKKEANLGDGANVSSEPQVLCSLTFDSVLNMEDNCVFPSTSSQQVPDNKIKQTAKPKSSKGKARKKKGDNTPEDPYARVKRSRSQKLKGLPLDKAEQLRLKLNEQERNRQRAIREAIGELKQMDIPDFLSVDNYKVGCKCHTLRTVIAYIAHMMSQIENHDQIHGVSEHLQQQTQLHQQRLQEKLNVMQQEEAQYQLQQQELEKEILLHQQQSVQQQQLIQQQPQIQLETQQILSNLQQPQLLFNPQQLLSTNYQPQLQQHISPQFHPQKLDVQPPITVLLHQQQTDQEQSLLPSINPSGFPSHLSAPPMNSTSFNHAPGSVGSNEHFSSMYQGQYHHCGVNHFQLPVFAPQYYPAPMSWEPHGQLLGHVSVGPDVNLMNQGQSSKKKPSRKARSKKGKATNPARAAAESTTASTTSTASSDPGSHTGVSSKRKKTVLDDQNNIVFDNTSCPTFSDTISDFCLPTSDQRASGPTPSDSGYSSRSISRESDMGVD
ncbi:mediator of RNA polymerase II transcription subunit 15 [Biomphalaria pfeifferi]|uniref:Mediator of RNA polymerase II transcription subunit 15 n=1 Tax=Biomphalaria pfeifferi TaxID=112525 RepID=A0AAD8BYE2_BIOPF|nr:mediator of RNA polymerase II transcription subunit 15 [Biomphalaria pfeifferi]